MLKLFADMGSQGPECALTKVMHMILLDTAPAETSVCENGDEADLAIINSADKALRIYKETERTVIVIAYFGREAALGACALAGRFPDRIKAVALFDQSEESEGNTFLTRIAPVVEAVKAAKEI